MKIGNVNNVKLLQQKTLADYLFPAKRTFVTHERNELFGGTPIAKWDNKMDELILSINARAHSQLPQEQQYLRDENGYIRTIQVELAQRRIAQRDYMNKAVSDALRENGIEIADGENYEISVDASYTVRVSGDNAEKAERIAVALNSALVDPNDKIAKSYNTTSLSRLLFVHVLNSTHDFPVQATKTELKKYGVDSALRQWTGLSVNDLNFTEDGIYTPDGRDIFEVISRIVAENTPNGKEFESEAAAAAAYLKNGLTSLQKIGVANIKDVELRITLGADGLFDIGIANGFGVSQRGWYERLLSSRSKTDPNSVPFP